MFDICDVAVNATDGEWLRRLTRELIATGFVARGHLWQVQSMHPSAAGVTDQLEFRASLHTRRSNVTTIIDLIERNVEGRASSIVVLPVTDGHPTYLQWVRSTTKAPR